MNEFSPRRQRAIVTIALETMISPVSGYPPYYFAFVRWGLTGYGAEAVCAISQAAMQARDVRKNTPSDSEKSHLVSCAGSAAAQETDT